VEKYGRSRQAADGSIIRNTRFACWIIMATDTHDMYYLLAFTVKMVTGTRVNITFTQLLSALSSCHLHLRHTRSLPTKWLCCFCLPSDYFHQISVQYLVLVKIKYIFKV
jgi:hypothetical protein